MTGKRLKLWLLFVGMLSFFTTGAAFWLAYRIIKTYFPELLG